MKPSRDEVVEALRAMSKCELVEIVYEALQAFDRDEYRLRVAQSYQTQPCDPPDVEFIALPVDGHERPGVDELYQQGMCDRCSTRVVSVSKLACCPICASEVCCT